MAGDLEAGRLQKPLGDVLVHRRGRGGDARPHTRHAGQLGRPLDGAVLAVGPVQDRKQDVERGRFRAVLNSLRGGQQLSAAARQKADAQAGFRHRSGDAPVQVPA